jgi:4-aminobutyrate aminotransferase/(S)-3-amino-2-methylpropionate transaminase
MPIKKIFKIRTKNRNIKTFIPAPGTKKILKKLESIESRSMHGQMPIVWEKAKDYNVYDIAGNKFIDFTSTIFVANIGHSNSKLVKRLKKTLDNDLISTYSFANKIRIKYIEKLLKFSGSEFEKAFLLSSGTEASEVVLKLMKLNGIKIKKRKLKVISVNGNWHGRTMGAQSLSSDKTQNQWLIGKKEVNFIDFPYPWVLKEKKISGANFAKEQILNLKKKTRFKERCMWINFRDFSRLGSIILSKRFCEIFSQLL